VALSPESNAATTDVIRYDLGWNAINTMLRAGRSLSGHERNCCFLNTGGQRFADISGAAGLDFADDGRVLSLADWDYDGDVDFWIANRSGPQVRYLQNNIIQQATRDSTHFVVIRLEGVDCNRDAIGARVTIEVDGTPKRQTQTLRAGEGYLSQSSKWLHFGLGHSEVIQNVTVHWPGGKRQSIENLIADHWYKIRQGDQPRTWRPPQRLGPRTPSDFQAPPVSDKARIVLLAPLPLPELTYIDKDDNESSFSNNGDVAQLVNLWASWCQPCLEELSEWQQHADKLSNAGLKIVLLNVDEADDQTETVPQLLERLDLPFQNVFASEALTAKFDVIQRSLLSRQRPLPVPSSFLIDRDGQLRIVYKGPVTADVLVRDAGLLHADRDEILVAAMPFPGKWLEPPGGSTPLQLAVKLIEGGYSNDAERYIAALADRNSLHLSASLLNLQGAILSDKKQFQPAASAYARSLVLDPANRQAHIELGSLLLGIGQGALAEPHFTKVLTATPNDPELIFKLGVAHMMQGKVVQAQQEMRRALESKPIPLAYWHLADMAIAQKDTASAIDQYEAAIRIDPEMINKANNLAWLLATSDEQQQRDGKRAVEVAERICHVQGEPTAGSLDTLAAAYAEAERYGDAVKAATRALHLAEENDNRPFASQIKQRLVLYRQNRPFHEPLK